MELTKSEEEQMIIQVLRKVKYRIERVTRLWDMNAPMPIMNRELKELQRVLREYRMVMTIIGDTWL